MERRLPSAEAGAGTRLYFRPCQGVQTVWDAESKAKKGSGDMPKLTKSVLEGMVQVLAERLEQVDDCPAHVLSPPMPVEFCNSFCWSGKSESDCWKAYAEHVARERRAKGKRKESK